MVLGYIIATSLICSLMFVPNTNPDWNIHSLIVASSLLSASLTEACYFLYHAKPVVRDLEPQLHRFWVVLNVILVPAPNLSSLILFSPIDLNPSTRLTLVYLVAIFVFLRSYLAAWAHIYIAIETHPDTKSLKKKSFFAVLFYITCLPVGLDSAKWDVEQQRRDQQQHVVCKNAARVSIIECVVLLGVSISAKWWFDPAYVSVRPWSPQTLRLTDCRFLITLTIYSRMYVAVSYYENHGLGSMNGKASSASAADVHKAGTSLASIASSHHDCSSWTRLAYALLELFIIVGMLLFTIITGPSKLAKQ
ncbi:hypothetical protein PMIN06_012871 [Paraphaeosphaeria minitans]